MIEAHTRPAAATTGAQSDDSGGADGRGRAPRTDRRALLARLGGLLSAGGTAALAGCAEDDGAGGGTDGEGDGGGTAFAAGVEGELANAGELPAGLSVSHEPARNPSEGTVNIVIETTNDGEASVRLNFGAAFYSGGEQVETDSTQVATVGPGATVESVVRTTLTPSAFERYELTAYVR